MQVLYIRVCQRSSLLQRRKLLSKPHHQDVGASSDPFWMTQVDRAQCDSQESQVLKQKRDIPETDSPGSHQLVRGWVSVYQP